MKVRILQSYVNDLGDQNQVLVQTVEDLKTEANNRVCTIEAKLRTSDQIIHVSLMSIFFLCVRPTLPSLHPCFAFACFCLQLACEWPWACLPIDFICECSFTQPHCWNLIMAEC